MKWMAIVGTLALAAMLLPSAFADKSSAPGVVGQVCSGKKKCRTGLTCSAANLCVAPTKFGAACTGDSCGLGATCIDGICAAHGKLGEACTASNCVLGLACIAGVCVGGGGAGQACLPGGDCQTGLACINTVCVVQ